ncbi:MAG: cobalt-zinc-cadmium efflux system outer membrane protein [Planctomycetota bacterium]|jgi:cobalt-zinc-cadmium efflux system outer membrane protein
MPVDLDQHLRDFQLRTPTAKMSDGMRRSGARELAKMFHPDARLARRRAGVAGAQRDHAGAWADPQLQTQLQRILETVPHDWVAQVQLGFTIPINGRLQKQRELADRRNDEALISAWAIEQRVANDVDEAWVDWSASQQRVSLFTQTCGNLEQLAEIAQALVDTGGLTRPGARVFTLEHRQQTAQRDMAIANEQAARLEVLRRIGLHPDAVIELQGDMNIRPFVADAKARRSALPNSPGLISQQLEHLTAEANLHLQVRKQWPDLQLGPIWQEEDAQPRPGIGLNLPLPIFTGNDPAIAQATAQRELTAEALRAALEQLLQELAIAEVRHAASEKQATQFRELIGSANQQIEDSRNLASAGQLDPMLMLDALLRAHNVQMQAIAADATAARATITINTLLTDPQSQTPAMSTGDNR